MAIFKRTMVKAMHPVYGVRYYCLSCARMLGPTEKVRYVLAGAGVLVLVGRVQERWEVVQIKNQACAVCQH